MATRRGSTSNPDPFSQDRGANMRPLVIVAHAVKLVSRGTVDHGSTSAPRQTARRWRSVDRLGEHIISDLIRESHSGATKRVLAWRYEISLSSVKRILRREHD
jgi:hypothetical protein